MPEVSASQTEPAGPPAPKVSSRIGEAHLGLRLLTGLGVTLVTVRSFDAVGTGYYGGFWIPPGIERIERNREVWRRRYPDRGTWFFGYNGTVPQLVPLDAYLNAWRNSGAPGSGSGRR
jgi:hypothetical protein